MRLIPALVAGLVAQLTVCLYAYVNARWVSAVDPESLVLISVLAAVMIGLLTLSTRISLPLVLILVAYVWQKYLLGTLYLVLLPEYGRWYYVELYADLTPHDWNASLVYAILGTLAAGIGLVVGTARLPGNDDPAAVRLESDMARQMRVSPAAIFMLYMAVQAVDGYLFFALGSGRHYAEASDSGFNWLNILRNTASFLYLIVAMLFFGWERLRRWEQWLLLLVLLHMTVISIVRGSRSFVYNGILLVAFMLATRGGNFRVRKRLAAGLAVAGLLAVVSFPLGLAFRQAGRDLVFTTEGLLHQLNYYYLHEENSFRAVAVDILNRVTESQPSLRIMNGMEVVPVGHEITLFRDLARVINALVPGDLFLGVMPANQLYDYLYLGNLTTYNTQEWGVFEYGYVLFDYVGGLAVVFVIVFAIGVVWRWIIATNAALKPFLLVFVLFWFWHFMRNLGYSLWLSSFSTELIVFVFFYVILRYVLPFLRDVLLEGAAMGRRRAPAR